ncbi:MAG TPA: ABC transporter ATP-binding protein [Planktothrix sp.]|jgi:ABC-2 type transport system ATP-binding protein
MDAAIEASKLTKDVFSSFLRKRTGVLHGVDLTVSRGETYGLLGPNGAGKTTVLKILLGLMKPTSGQARLLQLPAGDRTVLCKIGYLPENPYFYTHLTGREFLAFIGQLFGMEREKLKEKSDELLALVKMSDNADKQMHKYSKGMLQRLGIAQSLINDPEIIFWDEPMSGLDPIGRRDVRGIIMALKEQGKTIFFNSHLLPDVHEVCDRVGVLCKGRLVAEETVGAISATATYKDLEEYFMAMIAQAEAQGAQEKTAAPSTQTSDESEGKTS